MNTASKARLSKIVSLVLVLVMTLTMCFTSFPASIIAHALEESTVSGETLIETPIYSATGISATEEAPYVYEGYAAMDGMLHIVTGPDKASVFKVDIYGTDGKIRYEGTKQSQGITILGGWQSDFEIFAGEKYIVTAYAKEGVLDFNLTLHSKSNEVVVAEYKYSSVYNNANPLKTGTYDVSLEENAENTLFVFSPDAIGVYSFAVSEDNTIGYWGAGTYYVINPKSTTCLISIEIKAVGQSAVIGIASSSSAVELTISKTGESSGIIETTYVPYENKHTPVAGTYPTSGYQSSYINIFEDHSAVLGADGFYHLDSANGPVIYVDLVTEGFDLSAAYGQYGATSFKCNWDNINYDFKPAMKEYYDAAKDGGNVYYLTEDLIAFFKAYGTKDGWYDPAPEKSYFPAIQGKDPASINPETAWMVACFVAIGESADFPIDNKIIAGGASSSYEHKAGAPIYYALKNTADQDIKIVADTAGFKVIYNGITYETEGAEFTLTGVSANAVVGIDGTGYFTVTAAASQGASHTHEIAELTKVDAVAPTHTANGTVEYYTCTECTLIFDANGEQITGSIVDPATGHIGATKVDKVDATCTVNGTIEYYACAECGKNYRGTEAAAEEFTEADLVIPAKHTWGEPVVVAPTCLAEGTETVYCTVCNEKLSETRIAYAAHIKAERTVNSTCTTKGSVETYCTVCDVVITKTLLPLADHNYDENDTCTVCGDVLHICNFAAGEVVAPTCTKGGYTVYTCDSCGATEHRDATAALGHTAGEPVVVESTCTVQGSKTISCTVCSAIVSTQTLELKAHTPTTPVTVAPTCTQKGSETTNCSVCGKVVSSKVLATVDHNYVSGACSVCGAEEPEAPAADTFNKITGAAELKAGDEIILIKSLYGTSHYAMSGVTTTSTGYSVKTLIVNNGVIDNSSTNFETTQILRLIAGENGTFILLFTKGNAEGKYVAHSDFINGTSNIDEATRWIIADSTTAGDVTFQAQDDTTKYIYSPASGNSFRTGSKASISVYRKPAPAAEAHDHILSEMNRVDYVNFTHTANGNIEYYTCDKCDVILDEYGEEITLEETVLLAMGHMNATKVEGVAATHTANGNIAYYYCSTCKANFIGRAPEAEMIPEGEEILLASGHTNAEKVTMKPATCFENGNIEYYYCETCKANFVGRAPEAEMIPEGEEVILSMGHNRATKFEAVAPTCTENGNVEYYYCDVCKANYNGKAPDAVVISDVVLPKTGHDFVDGACSVCGELSHEHILSEMNKVEGVSATHTTNGNWEYYTCDKCDVILDAYGEEFPSLEETVILASGHGRNITVVEAKEATCTENGNILYYYCNSCKKAYDNGKSPEANELTEEDYTILATGHNYANGYCTVCNEADPDYVAPANPEFTQASATQLKAGDEIIIVYNATTWQGTTTTALTSTASGTNLAGIAITINGTKLENIDATVMILILEDAGNGNFYLKNKSTGKYLSASAWTTGVDSTADATAYTIADATGEKVTFTNATTPNQSIALVGSGNFKVGGATSVFVYKSTAAGAAECDHNMVQTGFVAATCLTQSLTTYTCSKCGKTEVVRGNEIIGHKNSPEQTLAPTCTEEGYDYRECTVCGEIQITPNTTVAPLGHDNVFTQGYAATHTATGMYSYYTCRTCGTITDEWGDVVDSVDLLVIASQGHGRINPVEAVAPTCTEAGNVKYYYCSVCDKNYDGNAYDANEITDVVILATGIHTPDEDGFCTVCGHNDTVAEFEAMQTEREFAFSYSGDVVTEVKLRFFMTMDKELYDALVAMGAVFGIEASCTKNGVTKTNSMFNAAFQPVEQADGTYNYALVFNNIGGYYNANMTARVFVEIDGARYYMQSANNNTIAADAELAVSGDQYTEAEKAAIGALGN